MAIYNLYTWYLDGDIYEFFVKDKRLVGCLNGEVLPIDGLPGEFKEDISVRFLPALQALLRGSYFSLEVFYHTHIKAIKIQPLDKTELYENVYYKDCLLSAS